MNEKRKSSPFDFEKGMHRLEEIISMFDEGGLPLDRMESIFIEGMDLVKKCSERLDSVETRVTELLKESDSSWSERPFEESDKEE